MKEKILKGMLYLTLPFGFPSLYRPKYLDHFVIVFLLFMVGLQSFIMLQFHLHHSLFLHLIFVGMATYMILISLEDIQERREHGNDYIYIPHCETIDEEDDLE